MQQEEQFPSSTSEEMEKKLLLPTNHAIAEFLYAIEILVSRDLITRAEAQAAYNLAYSRLNDGDAA